MAQNEKPLFPRELESDSEVQSDLLKDVKQKLEVAEGSSEFELPVIMKERFMPPPAPAYGPPPLPFGRTLIFVFILVGFLLALFLIIYLFVR
jgi:hypothetical protein